MITGDFFLPVAASLSVSKFLLCDAVQEIDVGVSVASGTWY